MKRVNLLLATLILFIGAVPALAHGDRIITQMADGAGVIRTKIDITNLSRRYRTSQNQLKVLFFLQNGSPWSLETNRGNTSQIPLDLGRFQTIRIETKGSSPTVTAGYAIVRNTQTTSSYVEDFEIAITVYYEILSGGNVVDTVSVPLGRPTVVWILPVEIDASKNLFTGFAIVNLADAPNNITLRLWEAADPPTGDAADGGTVTFTMDPKQQRAQFLNEPGLFATKTKFRGMMYGFSERPVSILALLQTSTPSGVQYATLVAEHLDSLRKNSYMYLRQGFPLDIDIAVVDYLSFELDPIPPEYDDFTWDLRYETQSNISRRIVPISGAMLVVIGLRSPDAFDSLSLEEIQGLTYSSNTIDMSDNSTNLGTTFTFAIRTALGTYAKIRIADVITRQTSDNRFFKDLALEIFVYK